MGTRMHEGTLYRDSNRRYSLREAGIDSPEFEITFTSGQRMDIWLGGRWIAGHVEGDREDYYFFADLGGKCRLMEGMKAGYLERW
jgi:hypothetical protein